MEPEEYNLKAELTAKVDALLSEHEVRQAAVFAEETAKRAQEEITALHSMGSMLDGDPELRAQFPTPEARQYAITKGKTAIFESIEKKYKAMIDKIETAKAKLEKGLKPPAEKTTELDELKRANLNHEVSQLVDINAADPNFHDPKHIQRMFDEANDADDLPAFQAVCLTGLKNLAGKSDPASVSLRGKLQRALEYLRSTPKMREHRLMVDEINKRLRFLEGLPTRGGWLGILMEMEHQGGPRLHSLPGGRKTPGEVDYKKVLGR